MHAVDTPVMLRPMPNSPSPDRSGHHIRLWEWKWARLGRAAKLMRTDRTAVLEAFGGWYMRVPGAKLPDRPPADWQDQAKDWSAGRTSHSIRYSKVAWKRLGPATALMGTDRTAIFEDFAAWYGRERGAKLPERPPAGWEQLVEAKAS